MERLRSILHEQGREIDQLKMENLDHKKRIKNLETCLEEEMKQRQGNKKLTFKIFIYICKKVTLNQ